jgi:hypothetical protein
MDREVEGENRGDSLAAGPACVLAVRVGVGEPCRARRLPLRGLVAVAFSVGTSGCGLFGPNETCGPYPDWSTSPYILPYDPGQSFGISQGNCTSGSHQGQARHAYDFEMPLRTRILSIADGVVIDLRDDRPEGTDRIQDDNLILVRHDDETIATYVHIAPGGAQVAVGVRVEQGQLVALSGNSGSTGGLPHLHFQLTTCVNRNVCGTLPVTFRNTTPNPDGLDQGRRYPANAE